METSKLYITVKLVFADIRMPIKHRGFDTQTNWTFPNPDRKSYMSYLVGNGQFKVGLHRQFFCEVVCCFEK